MRKTTVILAMVVAAVAWLSIGGAASAATDVHTAQAPVNGIPAQPPVNGAPLSVRQFNSDLGVSLS